MRARFERERPTPARVAGGKEAAQKALIDAVEADDPDAVARAVASDADVEAKVYNSVGDKGSAYPAAHVAAGYNMLRALAFLVGPAGADPNADGGSTSLSSSGKETPCFAACFLHNHDAVRILVARGARPDHSRHWIHKCRCAQCT